MNPGGDAAEQVVRLSLEGAEVAARISGNGAKNIALLLYAALKEEQKTKGKARLTNMLKTGKELKVYTITNKDIPKFSKEAKRYGVLYCVLKDKSNHDPNAAVDVIARAEDASKIQRITERFRLATIDMADISLGTMPEKDRLFGNPMEARAEKDRLSEPSSKPTGLLNGLEKSDKPSVKQKLIECKEKASVENTERMIFRMLGPIIKGKER